MEIEKPLSTKVRDFWWNYPKWMKSVFRVIGLAVLKFRPYSIIIIVSVVVGAILFGLVQYFPSAMSSLRQSESEYLIEAVVSPMTSIDPLPTSSIPSPETQFNRDLNALIFGSLVRVDKQGDLVPNLASNVTMLDDAKTISVNVRKDVKWQDGHDFSIEDVLFTFDMIDKIGKDGIYYASVDGAKVNKIDDYTFSIKLGKPNPAYVETLVWPVLPKHLLEGIEPARLAQSEFSSNPVGTGQFMISGVKQNEIILKRNDLYWGEKPKIEGIIFKLFETVDEAEDAVRAGVAHSFCYYDLLEADDSRNIGGEIAARYSTVLPKRNMVLYFNLRKTDSIFAEKEVRQALAYATPKQQIVREVLGGNAEIAKGPIPEWSWAYNDKVDHLDYDLKKAREILTEAGYKRGDGQQYRKKEDKLAEISITYQEDTVRQKIAEKIKESWESVGVKTNLIPIEYKLDAGNVEVVNVIYQNIIPGRDFETLLLFQETTIDPDRYSHFHSSNIEHPGYNLSGYNEIRADTLELEEGRKTANREKRVPIYKDLQERLLKDVPVVYIFNPHVTYWVSNRVDGVDLDNLVLPEDRFMSISQWEIH